MNFESFNVEYLVVFDTKDSICTDLTSFNHLLQANNTLKIEEKTLTYRDFTINYLVQTEVLNEQQRYFHIKLQTFEVNKVDHFEELLKYVRTILTRVSKSPVQTLWDDMSFYYAVQAYPLIHVTENLMRKLITKFMLINVGFGWTKTYIPNLVKDSVKKKFKENIENSPEYLYETDFIQLANFLFLEYQTEKSPTLIEKIKSVTSIEELSLNDLKSYAPKSNWERYFSTIVDCDLDYLKKRWESLYDLRNKIAHNNRINKEEFIRLRTLVDEIEVKLREAIDNLDKIQISTSDKEELTENIIINTDVLFSQFMSEFKKLNNVLIKVLQENSLEEVGPFEAAEVMFEEKLIDELTSERIKLIVKIRNRVIHEGIEYNASQLETLLKNISEAINVITGHVKKREKIN
ncbi:hypothetical protein CXK86_20465 [Paenibacillus sp. BGI2013]|uniref:HEPN domain-containing protein n=1 Tax=Paenibacillus sp. BGI2013 TaxID=2058902 RepID=UPI000C6E820B|nr:HEPN domain-containing protein [Paenibacillus sp. BGI2013]PKQ89422.1 hypothetical protein CXK86_20465 [Paenibacillus sp. BGI2013]